MYPCKFLESRKIQGYITFQKGLQWRTHTGGMIHTDSNIRHFNIHVFRHTLFKYTLVVLYRVLHHKPVESRPPFEDQRVIFPYNNWSCLNHYRDTFDIQE